MERKDFIRLMGLGGVVFASRLEGFAAPLRAAGALAKRRDFHFVQLTDTHWGYAGPANPDAAGTLPKAIEAVNGLAHPPDFIVFTGDLTHTTEDGATRRARLAEFKAMVAKLKVQRLYFLPGEHDAGPDQGEAFREFFGPTHYAFDHGGFHFIALDNVSQPGSRLGEAQLKWLAEDLARLDKAQPIVVFAHRPLFDLYPDWDWATLDGPDALELLKPFEHVTVFYGHIHQEHHATTGRIAHHAATSLMFPLPAPGSLPKRIPLPWNPASPYKGLGFREVDAEATPASRLHTPRTSLELDEIPLRKA
ncbi:MAG TPA: metallophosphoesterase [Holophagaceae bacterium]|nr:metallophosphoesterase [Holophagaceae bacterium]